MSRYSGVLIIGEITDGKLSPTTTEILGCGRRLADELRNDLSAVIVGRDVNSAAQEAIYFGADRVYLADNDLFNDYHTDSYMLVMEKLAQQMAPQIILLGQTSIGRDLAPRLAFRLQSGAFLDCVNLALDPDTKRLMSIKPVFGGNAQAVFSYKTYPQIATIRAKVMLPLERNTSKSGEVIGISVYMDSLNIRTKIVEKVPAEIIGIKLEDAPVVVSGGRGIGGAEGFKELSELTNLFNGAVGASRAACDNGWMPDTVQVGLTGKIVTPDLYI